MEIYNGTGYDLLDENHTTKEIEDLPKITPRVKNSDEIILDGLSIHRAQNEEDALNLLFIGDTNRVVCETVKNKTSTRSHCIFILQIESRASNSDVKRVARMHLVDLSGSERIGKTGTDGKLRTEAICINMGLHFLERVIISLNKKAKGENIVIPYRESLMTMVLRDSLGGNCKTKMIATASSFPQDVDESISTCKFAMRVASVKNILKRNESLDPAMIIKRLKKENMELKAEIALLTGTAVKDHLDEEDMLECKEAVEKFIISKDPSATITMNDRLKIKECFFRFKHMY